MAFCHLSVDDASQRFLDRDRRYYYTTPKSFLELIAMYTKLLARKRSEVQALKVKKRESNSSFFFITCQNSHIKILIAF